MQFPPRMCKTWFLAYTKYDWTVDLSTYAEATEHSGYFDQVITLQNVVDFENKFKQSIEVSQSFVVAGEVCYWKNYGSYQSRNRITKRLLDFLSMDNHWQNFVQALRRLYKNPDCDNFLSFRKTCNQPKGFATPLTFLSFYNPAEYPMVDKNIAYWWLRNRGEYGYDNSPPFSQRGDGWIQTYTKSHDRQNWNAYVEWARFCQDYSSRITESCGLASRARDVEMAVWEAQKKEISLNQLPAVKD